MTKKDLPTTCLYCKASLHSDPVRWGVRHWCECGKYEVVVIDEKPGDRKICAGEGGEMNEKVIIVVLVLALAVGAWYYVGRDGAGDSGGLDAIRSDIQRVEEQQRAIDARLDKISAGLDRGVKATETISARIAGIETTVDTVAGRIDSGKIRIEASAGLIDEGQRRLDDIRSRAKNNPAPPKN